MKNGKKKLIIAACLTLLSAVPESIGWFNFLHNGGMGWPMQWQNETIVWGTIFTIFSLSAIMLCVQNFTASRLFSTTIILFAAVIALGSYYDLAACGISPSSKSDEGLFLFEYWTSGWWK